MGCFVKKSWSHERIVDVLNLITGGLFLWAMFDPTYIKSKATFFYPLYFALVLSTLGLNFALKTHDDEESKYKLLAVHLVGVFTYLFGFFLLMIR